MKITVITGSPRKKGTTSALAEEFERGAKEAGHDVFRFDAAFEKLSPCRACDYCHENDGQCVQKDSMEKLNPELIAADYIVFITPLYYFGMSAQLKTAIDRFYAKNDKIKGSGKKTILLAAAEDTDIVAMKALVEHYKAILDYLELSDAGVILAIGCADRNDIEKTDYPVQAYNMGKGI